VLAIVPWIASQDGPTIDQICRRFDLSRAQLLSDLDVVFMVGIHPFTPDELIDVVIEDDRVWIRLQPGAFLRPLRLTPQQGLALVASGASLLAVPGTDPAGPLARGLSKLAAVLGIDDPDRLGVDLGNVADDVMDVLRNGVARRRQVELDYYAYGRDERSVRIVDPYLVFADQGQWYLSAWCHQADDERLFRVDRIRSARELGTGFDPPSEVPAPIVFHPRGDDPRVTLELGPDAQWVLEQYATESTEPLDGGRWRVRMAVSAPAWLERLLVRLGDEATIVSRDAELAAVDAASTAERILRRYEG